jgi:3-deoxy-D-manno-octulosonic-acid transferase
MYLLYSFVLSLGFVLMLPAFLLRHEKYASGFRQRMGKYPPFEHDERKVIWLHCVSVGETNAARPLMEQLLKEFPDHRVVVSTTTRTGQEVAKDVFRGKADTVFYLPFDWKFSVRRALENFRPSLVLLMETEIWPRFISEAKKSGAKVAIVNGRISERSFQRYKKVQRFINQVMADLDLAMMQTDPDAKRIVDLGLDENKVAVTGNLKFEQPASEGLSELTAYFRSRFGITAEKPLIIAASTHDPEERYVLEALEGMLGSVCRLMLVPRHPERFDAVERLLGGSSYSYVRRSAAASEIDKTADVILLDSIGELRAAYPLAEIVFVGGSLIPHGGQSILEPAAKGKAIITGPFTANFDAVVRKFKEHEAIRQLPTAGDGRMPESLRKEFAHLLDDEPLRRRLGTAAETVIRESAGDATKKTIDPLRSILAPEELMTESR